jgi:hypothetical protein
LLSIMLLSPNVETAGIIENLLLESSIFKLVGKVSPIRSAHEGMRLIGVHDPELILLDLGDWGAVSILARSLKGSSCRGVVVGFKPLWNRVEQLTFQDAGILDLLREPFSHEDLQRVAQGGIEIHAAAGTGADRRLAAYR